MPKAKVWKLMKGRWGGITATGKRITIVKSKEAARKLAGLTSGSRTAKSKTKRSKKNNPKRRKRNLARKRKRGKRKFTIPLAPIAGIIAAPAVREMIDKAMLGHVEGVAVAAGKFVGIKDGKFNIGELGANVLPVVIGCLVHKFVGGPPLNLNRMLASANVPVIRI